MIESHVSKLRKKLRDRLGFDAIVARRYVGYRLDVPVREAPGEPAEAFYDVATAKNEAEIRSAA